MQAAAQATLDFLKLYWAPLLCGVVIVAVLPLIVGYIVLVERKLMADMQARLGPMRVGPHGLLQPIADAVKLLIKEDIIPMTRTSWCSGWRRCSPWGRRCSRSRDLRLALRFKLRKISTLGFCLSWASARLAFSGLCWVGGLRTAITR